MNLNPNKVFIASNYKSSSIVKTGNSISRSGHSIFISCTVFPADIFLFRNPLYLEESKT